MPVCSFAAAPPGTLHCPFRPPSIPLSRAPAPLLQDLTAYKKFRNKEVSSAARSLIGLFRWARAGAAAVRPRTEH